MYVCTCILKCVRIMPPTAIPPVTLWKSVTMSTYMHTYIHDIHTYIHDMTYIHTYMSVTLWKSVTISIYTHTYIHT